VGGHDGAGFVEIGEVRHSGTKPRFRLPANMAGGIIALEFAEVSGEIDLLLIGERLSGENQDGIFVHARLDRSHVVRGNRAGQVDAGGLGREDRMQLAKCNAHVSSPP
jgi:hypothetical protein